MLTHRSTSNSRGPGQKNMPVTITIVGIACCVKCRRIRVAGVGPHAPIAARGGRVDCVGDRIPPEER